MDIIAVVVVGLVAALLSIIIKQNKPEFGMYISLLTGIIILGVLIAAIKPVLTVIDSLAVSVSLDTIYAEVMLKALAICFITQLVSDTCRDAGESAIASKLEMAGKLAIVLIALPLFEKLVVIITRLLE